MNFVMWCIVLFIDIHIASSCQFDAIVMDGSMDIKGRLGRFDVKNTIKEKPIGNVTVNVPGVDCLDLNDGPLDLHEWNGSLEARLDVDPSPIRVRLLSWPYIWLPSTIESSSMYIRSTPSEDQIQGRFPVVAQMEDIKVTVSGFDVEVDVPTGRPGSYIDIDYMFLLDGVLFCSIAPSTIIFDVVENKYGSGSIDVTAQMVLQSSRTPP